MPLKGGAINTLLFTPPDGKLLVGTRVGLRRCDISAEPTLRCEPLVRRRRNTADEPIDVRALAYEPGHRWMAVGGDDGTIRIGTWDALPEARPFQAQHLSAVNALSFDAGGALLASGGDDGTVRIWPINEDRLNETDQVSQVMVFDEGEGWVQTVAFDPDPRRPLLYSGSANGTVRVWMPHMDSLMSAICRELEDIVPTEDADGPDEQDGATEAKAYCTTFAALPLPDTSESASP